jgi:hypothetical protein
MRHSVESLRTLSGSDGRLSGSPRSVESHEGPHSLAGYTSPSEARTRAFVSQAVACGLTRWGARALHKRIVAEAAVAAARIRQRPRAAEAVLVDAANRALGNGQVRA